MWVYKLSNTLNIILEYSAYFLYYYWDFELPIKPQIYKAFKYNTKSYWYYKEMILQTVALVVKSIACEIIIIWSHSQFERFK